MYLSYQDFQKEKNKAGFIRTLISWHASKPETRTAIEADKYDSQRNSTINNYSRMYYDLLGNKKVDSTASNNKIASNFFHRLNTQRATYSLGNGITFSDDSIKEKLGENFDTMVYDAAYKALIHGVSFAFFNVDHLHVFPVTEFAPLYDEETGVLMAGVRYWQLDKDKPQFAVLYEIDGYTKYRAESNSGAFVPVEDKRAYRYIMQKTPAQAEPEIIATENYSALPIVPIYGSKTKLSTLTGMRAAIDSYDLIRSGFANDLTDCAEIYWLISNADGMDEDDLARFRDRMKLNHIVQAEEGEVTPYRQEIPFEARQTYLDNIRQGIYEDFGGLDVKAVSASNQTATAIEAAYQPLDENADDFEYQIINAVQGILALVGVKDTPVFKRNIITNATEQTNMILAAAQYLDEETVIKKLPFISTDEVSEILAKKDAEEFRQFNAAGNTEEETEEETEESEELEV